MAYTAYPSDFPFWLQTHSWPIYLDTLDERLREGDVIFLANQERGIYAWGNLIEKIKSDVQDSSRIPIGRGDIKESLVNPNQINQTNGLKGILSFSKGRFTFLTNRQVRSISNWLPAGKPPLPRKAQFMFGQPVFEDEGLHVEYKDVNLSQIPKHAYEYSIAFLSSEGGRILFGIKDEDKSVSGIELNYSERDKLIQTLESKLFSIVPSILPVHDYTIDFHFVIDSDGNPISNLYLIELEVKSRGAVKYKSAGGKSHLKTFSGKRTII